MRSGCFFLKIYIWNFGETILEIKYAAPLAVNGMMRCDLGFCPKREWLCRIGWWNLVFPRWHVFPRNQADIHCDCGRKYFASNSRLETCPYRNTRECPFSAFLAVEFLTLLRINSVKYLRLRSSVFALYWALLGLILTDIYRAVWCSHNTWETPGFPYWPRRPEYDGAFLVSRTNDEIIVWHVI